MRIRLLAVAVTAALLGACDNDDDKGLTGNFLDSAVSGLSYQSPYASGTTGSNGEFTYATGGTVTFSVGGVTVGSVRGTTTVLLKDLDGGTSISGTPSSTSINRAIFLQSLDDDQDPTNGIQVSSATRDKLKSAVVNFNQPTSAFAAALATAFTSAGISFPVKDAKTAEAHLLETEAQVRGNTKVVIQDGVVDSIQRFVVPESYVPYPGNDAGLKKLFPRGFPLAVGSGLAYDGKAGGTLTFYAITDRGPNADSPVLLADASATKVFTAPDFTPTFVKLSVDTSGSKGVMVSDAKTLNVNGVKISGRPLAPGSVGSSSETALNETLTQKLPFDAAGMDTEAFVKDPDGVHAWTCDEYGPFVAKVELASGKIVRKYAPGSGLPELIAKRQPNRGCEGLALTPNGKLYTMVQSTLDVEGAKNKALFTRIVEIDKSNEANPVTKTFAFPLTAADWEDGKTGKAKLGDMVAVDDTHFLVIEQGTYADHVVHNKIYLLDISDATDISTLKNGSKELESITTPQALLAAGVTTAKKYLIGDMRDYGWLLEKAEGLALIDNQTIALINDNDFGMGVNARDASGNPVDPTTLKVSDSGVVTDAGGNGGYTYKVAASNPSQRRTNLWIIKLAKPVLDFQQSYAYAQPGDLVNVALKDFHPTQPAIGFDQVYYKLGRYLKGVAKGADKYNKKFDDYCEDTGRKEADKATVNGASRLDNASSFGCKNTLGNDLAAMKTAVVGPQGKLYLTDGHHSFTSYWETADGGENMKVWVRITDNFSNSKTDAEFWGKMQAGRKVWLKDGSNNNAVITPAQLPSRLGLANGLHNDPYRALVYFTRDIGYAPPAGATEFLEFYWTDWMRDPVSGLSGSVGQMTDFATYLAAVNTAATTMSSLADTYVVSGGKTAAELGRISFGTAEYAKLSKVFAEDKPGKLAYALDYKAGLTP